MVRDNIEWLTPVSDHDGTAPQDDSHGNGHGTAMLSLIAGKSLGTAKYSKPYVVRLPRKSSAGGGWSPEDFLETVAEAANAMESRDGAAGVVLLAHYYPRSRFFRVRGEKSAGIGDVTFDESLGFEKRLDTIVNEIASKGYLIVTAAGNGGAPKVDGWPANFGADNPAVLVVGAVGSSEPSSSDKPLSNVDQEKGLPHVYAPGNPSKVAQSGSDSEYRDSTGSSDGKKIPTTTNLSLHANTFVAAALTAGLASYFLGLMRAGSLPDVSNSAQGLKDFIVENSWSRGSMTIPVETDGDVEFVESEVKVIFNGVDLTNEACKWTPEGGRDTGECEYPLEPSTTTSAVPTSTEESTTTDDFTSTTEPPVTTTFVETTTQPPEPTVTLAPWEIRNRQCHDESDFPDHVDIHRKSVENGAKWVCQTYEWFKSAIGPGGKGTYVHEYWEDNRGATFHFVAEWIKDCQTQTDRQYPNNPFEDDVVNHGTCIFIYLNEIWDGCNNGGVGGTVEAGCLRYNLEAGVPARPEEQRLVNETMPVGIGKRRVVRVG